MNRAYTAAVSCWGPISREQKLPFYQLCGLLITGYFRTESKISSSLGLPFRESSLETSSSLGWPLVSGGNEEISSCSSRVETPGTRGTGLSNKGAELKKGAKIRLLQCINNYNKNNLSRLWRLYSLHSTFTHISLLAAQHSLILRVTEQLSSPFGRWRKWVPEKYGLPKVTQRVGCRAGLEPGSADLQSRRGFSADWEVIACLLPLAWKTAQ